jgi:hypothetical protein
MIQELREIKSVALAATGSDSKASGQACIISYTNTVLSHWRTGGHGFDGGALP